jgi:hypothetical protein
MVKTDIEQLLQKQMDRKDFMKHTGIALLALSGVSGLLKTLLHTQTQSSLGYGSSVYGGQKHHQ